MAVTEEQVREALKQGDVPRATKMLGRYHTVRGEVVRGDARGRELGYPTANLAAESEGQVPAAGVYAGWVILPGGETLGAAISVGTNPTFTTAGPVRVEAYILDFDRDIYGETIELHFVERVRETETFENISDLLAAMKADVKKVREILEAAPEPKTW